MPPRTARANAKKSAIRAHIEHVFAEQKARMGLFVRTIGLARATTKIGLANLVYNMRAALQVATAQGYDLAVVSALLPAAEVGLVEALCSERGSAWRGDETESPMAAYGPIALIRSIYVLPPLPHRGHPRTSSKWDPKRCAWQPHDHR